MVKSITLNYRTDKDGNKHFDVYTVGQEVQFYSIEANLTITDIIFNEADYSAVINAVSLDEKGQADKSYQITQKGVHQVIEEF